MANNNNNNIFNTLSINDCLDEWVHDHVASPVCRRKITSVLRTLPPVSMTVYRGHKALRRSIEDRTWWATSSSRKVAEAFSNKDCCVFKIHVVNVPVLRVNDYLEESEQFKKEKEFLLLGGGTFYQSEDLSEPGFKLLKNGTYVAWYVHPDFPSSNTTVKNNKNNKNNTRKRKNSKI
jgi:hypothetical protein